MLADQKARQQLIDLFKTGTRLEYRKGESIVRSGDEPRGIYYIESGFVKAFAITKYGEENVLVIRREDDIFPLIWAVTGLHRDITYLAMSPAVVWRIARSELLDFIQRQEHAVTALLDMAIEAYRLHSERVMNLEFRTARERLAFFLLSHAERFGHKIGKHLLIDAPLKRSDIASSINISRETTSRELNALARKGYISLDGKLGSILILKPNELRRILEG